MVSKYVESSNDLVSDLARTLFLISAYEAESKKQITTPKKKAANTIRSATFAFVHGTYLS